MYCDVLRVERGRREDVGDGLGVGAEGVADDEVVVIGDGGGEMGDVVSVELG